MSQEQDNDCVICPACCHQFPAIPVNVQKRLGASPPEGGVVPVAWRIEYCNDATRDGSFWEWWEVTNGERAFKAESQEDAEMLVFALGYPLTSPPAAASEAVAALIEFVKTAPGRLPGKVQDAIATLSGASHV